MLNFKNIAETSSKNLKRMFSDYSNFLVKFKDSNLKLEMVGNFLDVLFRTDAKSANMLNEIKGVEMHSAIGLILKIDPDYIFTIQSQIDKLFDFPAKQIDMFRILGHVEHFKSKVGKYAGKDYEMRFGTWYEGLKQKILAKYNRIQRINAEAYELVNVPSSDSPSYFGTMENFGEEIQLVTNKFYDNIGLIGRFNGFRKYFFIENEYQFALNGWVEILNNSSNKDVFSLTEQNFKRIENSTLLKWVIVRAMLSRSEPPEEFIYKYVHEYLENISSQASLDFKKVNLLVSVILEGNSSITASNKGNFVDLIIYFLEGLRDKSTKIPAEAKYLFNFFARNFFEHGRPEDAESYAKLVKFFSTLKPGDYDFKYCDLNAIGI
ncbi:MAG: hypothetical protein QE271_03590 [Bacteriovoracaceae bacterium]|nr:hypothetical protein [Bacteriovoracaceae bacterium]